MQIITPTEARLSHEAWERTVRDPATYRSEGPRVIESGPCRAEYQIAPLPDGRWALLHGFTMPAAGCGSPWHAYASRQEALDVFVREAREYFASHPKMADRLSSATLFGFEEPEPEPRAEWVPRMVASQLNWLVLVRSWELMGVVRGSL